jgi:hypothetical protein
MGADGDRVAASGGVGSRGWVVERVVGALGDAAAGVRPDSRHAKVPGVAGQVVGRVSVMVSSAAGAPGAG